MKPARFRYARAGNLAEALALLTEAPGDTKLLAGGQSLVPMLNMRLVRPAVLVDVNGLHELTGITPTADGGLRIGALTRHAELAASPAVMERAPLLAAAARHVGHAAIRNQGTLGGSLAHADPAAELPAALLALDARVQVAGTRGTREVAADSFFRGLLTTALEPDEILTAIEVPAQPPGWGFVEIARRPGDFALAGVAAVVRVGHPLTLPSPPPGGEGDISSPPSPLWGEGRVRGGSSRTSSRRHSSGFLSSRNPMKVGCLRPPSSVQSVKRTSATRRGSTQWWPPPVGIVPESKGGVARASRRSLSRIALSFASSKPVPTLET
jgi:carbon-monoxide dehydrogenase medium subunit